MEEDAFFLRNLADLLQRVHRADLVVRVHDRDQNRLVGDRLAQVVEIDAAVLVDRQIGHLGLARTLQRLARVQNCLVLGDGCDDVVALVPVELDDALERQIVRLRGAAGEDDLLRLGVQQAADLLAPGVHRGLGVPSELMVTARRISELLREVRHHRLQHPRVHRGRGVIVHVNQTSHHRASVSIRRPPNSLNPSSFAGIRNSGSNSD
jgi:hypothetical protein